MLSKVDPDPRKEIGKNPDPDLDPERGLKWIRIRVRIRPNAVVPGGSNAATNRLLIKDTALSLSIILVKGKNAAHKRWLRALFTISLYSSQE